MPLGLIRRFVVSSRIIPRMIYLGPVLHTDGCPGCEHGGSDREATLCLLAPSFMTHFAGLNEKKALNLWDTRADMLVKSDETHAQEPYPARRSSAMPSVIDAPEVVEHGHNDLYEEQPRVYGTRAGFWGTVVQYVRQHRIHMPSRIGSSGYNVRHHLESPMAHVAQEHPMLYLQGFWGIHNG